MKHLTTLICICLMLAMFLGEVSTIIALIFPETEFIRVDPWLQPGFIYQPVKDGPVGVILTWFVKYNCSAAQNLLIYFVLAKAAYQYSFRLFLIAWIFFGYHVVDWFMLWWNFKTGYFMYWILNISIVIGVVILCRKEKQTAIVKSLE